MLCCWIMLTNDGKTQLRLAPVGRPTKLASNVAAGLCCAQNIENLLGDLFCAVFSAWKWQSRDCEMEHGLSEKFDRKRFLLCCESSLSVRPDQGNLSGCVSVRCVALFILHCSGWVPCSYKHDAFWDFSVHFNAEVSHHFCSLLRADGGRRAREIFLLLNDPLLVCLFFANISCPKSQQIRETSCLRHEL